MCRLLRRNKTLSTLERLNARNLPESGSYTLVIGMIRGILAEYVPFVNFSLKTETIEKEQSTGYQKNNHLDSVHRPKAVVLLLLLLLLLLHNDRSSKPLE